MTESPANSSAIAQLLSESSKGPAAAPTVIEANATAQASTNTSMQTSVAVSLSVRFPARNDAGGRRLYENISVVIMSEQISSLLFFRSIKSSPLSCWAVSSLYVVIEEDAFLLPCLGLEALNAELAQMTILLGLQVVLIVSAISQNHAKH